MGTLIAALKWLHQFQIRVPFYLLISLLPVMAQAQPQISTEASSTVLRVGVYENPPKIFVNSQGRPDGILWLLLESIAENAGWQLQPVQREWNDCLQQLETGRLDLMPDVGASDTRSLRFDFHQEPALFSWSQIYERSGAGIINLLDLQGRRLAVLEGSIQLEYLEGGKTATQKS